MSASPSETDHRRARLFWFGALGTLLFAAAWLGYDALHGPSWARAAHARRDHSAAAASRPNVVLFVIDTLRADRLNAYGYDGHQTSPHIDALAAEGALFEQAYAPAPWTLPSIASLLTSTYPPEHGALSTRTPLPDSLPTLAERLHDLGYATFGLYANAMVAPEFGFDRGFDRYQASGVNTAEQVEAVLRVSPGRPFFLYVHNIEPHNPELYAPDHMPGFRDVPRHVRDVIHRHYRAYRSATRVDFEAGRSPGATDTTVEQQRHMQALQDLMPEYRELYDAAVRLADERLGSVVRWLRKRGSWENTIFIFLSDHGEEFFEHDGFTHGQCVYEQVARVPLIVRFPGGRYAGRRIRDVVSLVDVLPTLLAALDEPRVAVRARGRNLLALIDARGVSGGLTPENVTSSEPFFVPCVRRNVMNHYGPAWLRRGDINVVVRSGRFKGIWNAEPGTLELYDLGLDAHEQCDLAGERPDLAAQMRDFARAWLDARSSAGDDSAGTIEQLDERTLRTLRALGYAD